MADSEEISQQVGTDVMAKQYDLLLNACRAFELEGDITEEFDRTVFDGALERTNGAVWELKERALTLEKENASLRRQYENIVLLLLGRNAWLNNLLEERPRHPLYPLTTDLSALRLEVSRLK